MGIDGNQGKTWDQAARPAQRLPAARNRLTKPHDVVWYSPANTRWVRAGTGTLSLPRIRQAKTQIQARHLGRFCPPEPCIPIAHPSPPSESPRQPLAPMTRRGTVTLDRAATWRSRRVTWGQTRIHIGPLRLNFVRRIRDADAAWQHCTDVPCAPAAWAYLHSSGQWLTPASIEIRRPLLLPGSSDPGGGTNLLPGVTAFSFPDAPPAAIAGEPLGPPAPCRGRQNGTSSTRSAGMMNFATTFLVPALSKRMSSLSPSIAAIWP